MTSGGGTCIIAPPSLPWVEKHRPNLVEDIRGRDDICNMLRHVVRSNDGGFMHLMLVGPCGTGKTTTWSAVASEYYGGPRGMQDMVMELNASKDRGIKIIRDRVMDFIETCGMTQSMRIGGDEARRRKRCVVFEEAEQMTADALSALRSLIETYANRVRFIFVVNNRHRIHDAISSRCLPILFPALTTEDVRAVLRRICTAEGVQATDEALEALAVVSNGDMRQAINMLQCAHAGSTTGEAGAAVTSLSVYRLAGRAPPHETMALLTSCLRSGASLRSIDDAISSYLTTYAVSVEDAALALAAHVVCPTGASGGADTAPTAEQMHQHWHDTLHLDDESEVIRIMEALDAVLLRAQGTTDPDRLRTQQRSLSAAFLRRPSRFFSTRSSK